MREIFIIISFFLFVGMAYANLAELDPIYGIYTAIFPVLIYTLLGPSRHVSMGEKKKKSTTPPKKYP